MIIESPSDVFKGTVEIPDALGWEQTVEVVSLMREMVELSKTPEVATLKALPHLLKLVTAWHIEGIPEHPEKVDDIPCKPFAEIALLLGFVTSKLFNVAEIAKSVPLASPSTPLKPRKAKATVQN